MRSHLLMPGAQIGQTFTTSTGTFTEVPDALRKQTTVRLNAVIMVTLSSLAGPEANTKADGVSFVGRVKSPARPRCRTSPAATHASYVATTSWI